MPRSTDHNTEQRLIEAYREVVHQAFQLDETMKAPGGVLAYRAWLVSMPSYTHGGDLPVHQTHIEVDELIDGGGQNTMIKHYTMTELPPGVAANYSSRVVGMTQVAPSVIEQAIRLNDAKDVLRSVEMNIPEGSRRKLRKRLLPPRHHMTYLLRKVSISEEPLERLTLLWDSKMHSQKRITVQRAREIVEQSRMLHVSPGLEEGVRAIELQRLSELQKDTVIVQRKKSAPSVVANGKLVGGGYSFWRLATPLMTTCELPTVIGPGYYSEDQPKERKTRKDKREYEPFIEKLGLWFLEDKRA